MHIICFTLYYEKLEWNVNRGAFFKIPKIKHERVIKELRYYWIAVILLASAV